MPEASAIGRPAGARTPPRLRVGIVGAGNIAGLAHIPGLRRTGRAEVVAVCDTDRERAEHLAARHGIGAVHTDHRRMLRESALDALTVATPPAAHAGIAIDAAAAGLHVLCEKPLATSVADAERMVEAAQRAGTVLALDMHFRSLRESALIRAAVDEGRLGRVGYALVRYLRRDLHPAVGSWALDRRRSGGGALADMGPHVIDLALWLCGATGALEVDAHVEPAGAVEDFASLRLRLDTGATAIVECGWRYPGPDESRIQLLGDRGGVDTAPTRPGRPRPVAFHVLGGEDRFEPAPPVEPDPAAGRRMSWAMATGATSPPRPRARRSRLWQPTMAAFVAAALGEASGIATGRDGLAVQRILDAAYRSAAGPEHGLHG